MDGKHDDFDISSVERAILRVASRPPMPGILMSISTTSTAFVRHHLTASSPHDASPTTFIPFISSRMRRIPARTSSWSSTSRTLIKGISPEIGITLLIVSHSYISGFYCNFETLKMVGIRFFSRFCQFDCPQLWSRPSPTAYRIVSQ